MIETSVVFLTKILLEFYNKNLDDVWYIYFKDCRFDMNSTKEITKLLYDLCLKNHTRIQYYFFGIFMD